MLSPQPGNGLVVDGATATDFAIVLSAPFLILEEHEHCAALVGVRAAQAVVEVGANAVQDRIAQAVLAHVAR